MMTDHPDLADREDRSPSPALHHHHAEDVAGDINQDAKQGVKCVSRERANYGTSGRSLCRGPPRAR